VVKKENEGGAPSSSRKTGEVKSSWEIAQERAQSLLQRSDEELRQEEEKKERKADSAPSASAQGAERKAASDESAEYLEHLQRLQAEFANYRKRVEREKAEFVKYAAGELLGELTEVLEAFERSLDEDHTEAVPEAYLNGIKSVYRKFDEILQRRGLQRIKTVGEPFNPEIHEAAMQEATDAYPPGTISEEIRPGYTLGDRLLRAPMVKVAVAPSGNE